MTAFPLYMVWTLNLEQSTKSGLAFLMCGEVLCDAPDATYDPLLITSSAAAATIAEIWYMRASSQFTDITSAWRPISMGVPHTASGMRILISIPREPKSLA